MTSQTGQQMLTIQILDNISRHKGSQAMKSGQYNIKQEIFLFKNNAENKAGRLFPNVFLFF